MNQERFNELMYTWGEARMKVMRGKSAEYANDEDKLANFKRAAPLVAKANTPEAAAWNMNIKHLCSIVDMIEKEANGHVYSIEIWREKFGDAQNYLDLIYARIVERLEPRE